MTCIIGLVHDGKVWLGGDSAGTDSNYSQTIRADQKVFQSGPFLMGFCGSFRMGQLLHYTLRVPEQRSDQGDEEFMCTTFIEHVRECLRYGGFTYIDKNVESGGNFLVGYRGSLYEIEEDFQVGRPTKDFLAIGCAEDFAMGAMNILMDSEEINPKTILRTALKTAEEFSAGVAGPFVIMKEK